MFLAALVAFLLLPHADVRTDHVVGYFFRYGRAPTASLGDVLANFVRSEDDTFGIGVFVVHVNVGDVLGEFLVGVAGRLVEHEEEDIETGKEGGGEVDILDGGESWVVTAVEGVGGCEDGCASVEGGGDACFRDGDGLLFHDFVDRGAVSVVHFVELVYTADAIVCED